MKRLIRLRKRELMAEEQEHAAKNTVDKLIQERERYAAAAQIFGDAHLQIWQKGAQ